MNNHRVHIYIRHNIYINLLVLKIIIQFIFIDIPVISIRFIEMSHNTVWETLINRIIIQDHTDTS